jgi:hypothetical protein
VAISKLAYTLASTMSTVIPLQTELRPEWRLDKVTSFSYICCGAAFLSSDDEDD